MTKIINTYHKLKKLEGHNDSSPYFCITENKLNQYHRSLSIKQIHEIYYNENNISDFYIISITPYLWKQIIDIQNVKFIINYGLNKIAFINKVNVGEHIKLTANIKHVKKVLDITKIIIGFNIEIKERELKAIEGEAIFLLNFKA